MFYIHIVKCSKYDAERNESRGRMHELGQRWSLAGILGMWLRGRTGVLLSEGHLFFSPGLHVEVSLGRN